MTSNERRFSAILLMNFIHTYFITKTNLPFFFFSYILACQLTFYAILDSNDDGLVCAKYNHNYFN